MSQEATGIITAAVRSRRYLEMAVDMALSVRAHSDLPVTVVTDERIGSIVDRHYRDVFDQFVTIADRFRVGRATKYAVADATPYEYNLFVDADAWVLEDPTDLIQHVRGDESPPVVVHGWFHTSESEEEHHHFRISELIRRFELGAYLKSNSGVFAFRKSAAITAMEDLLRCYRDELRPGLKGGWVGDENAIGVRGEELGFGIFPLPGPMHWPWELEKLDLENFTKPIVHLIGPVPMPVLAALTEESEARRRQAQVRTVGSAHWTWKQGLSSRPRWKNALLHPLERVFGRYRNFSR